MVFLAAENENRQLRDLPQADFGRVHENISFDDKEKVSNCEFSEKKVTPIICFCNGSTHFFILSFITDAIYDFFFGDRETSIFILWKSRLFFSVKANCVYMINKIIHGCLQSWSFSSRVQLDTKRL